MSDSTPGGRRSSGYWDTHVWLNSKEEFNTSMPDTKDARSLIEGLGSNPNQAKEDVFEVKDNPNFPESKKKIAELRRSA